MNYFDHSLNAISTITGCISVSAFATLSGIPLEITSSATGLKFCVITAGIKKFKSINKKNKKEHDKRISLAKSKLNNIVLISRALFDSNISHDELVLANNVLKEFMKEEIKNYKI